jgi:hypothetical protein
MVGLAGLLRLARWWRHRDAGLPVPCGEGGVFPDAEQSGIREAGTAGTEGAGIRIVEAPDVGRAAAKTATSPGRGARHVGAADTVGKERR